MLPNKLTALIAVAALVGCSSTSTLTPAPGANEVTGRGEGAIARAAGVEMVARAGAWHGDPSNLAQRLTPMMVTIRNDSGQPIRIRYNELMLVTPMGTVYKALPPVDINAAVSQRYTVVYPPSHFRYAPYYSPLLHGVPIYDRSFAYHRPYWDRYGTVMRKVELPTLDMLQRALPEGVLETGGVVSGFVYFPGIGANVNQVNVRADLMNAETGQRLTTLAIPFQVG